MFEMPHPAEQHGKLKSLTGTWVGEETIHPSPFDPKGGKATGRTESRLELNGFYLVTDYVQERGGQTSYLGPGRFGFEARRIDHNQFERKGCATAFGPSRYST